MMTISSTAVPSMASRAVSAKSPMVMRSVDRESLSWKRTSSAVYVGLTVLTATPATAAPWKTMANSGMFGAMRAMVSPRPRPRAARPPANEWMRPLSWP